MLTWVCAVGFVATFVVLCLVSRAYVDAVVVLCLVSRAYVDAERRIKDREARIQELSAIVMSGMREL